MRYFLAGLLLGTLALAAILARRFRVHREPDPMAGVQPADPYLDEYIRANISREWPGLGVATYLYRRDVERLR